VETAAGVATRSAEVLFPSAQYPTRASAASSALGCGAGGTAGATVVGTDRGTKPPGAVVVGATLVVVPATNVVVVAEGVVVVDAAFGVELQAAAVTPRTAMTAAVRIDRLRVIPTIPL